jgi:hypothetical protein
VAERVVEATTTAKPRRHRDLGDRQTGLREQAHGKVQTPGLRDRNGRGADVPSEQAQQVPSADT